MTKITKKIKLVNDFINENRKEQHNISDAIELLKKCPQPKFEGSVDVSIKLSINPTKTTQNVRGFAQLPHGVGKPVKIAVFAQGDEIEIAKKSGADIIITSQDESKDFAANPDVNYCVATAAMMPTLAKWGLSKVLGPKGLMPNAKMGTLSSDITQTVKNLKLGQAMFKNDKAGYLHTTIGRITFTQEQLVENFHALIQSVNQCKPAEIKATLIQSVRVNATMCPSFKIKL